jgi:Glycosyl hydrolases family 35/Beta-galactosidase, domain 2
MDLSRRKFLQFSVAAPVVVAAGDRGAPYLIAAPAGQGQEQFENPQIVRYDAQCFTLNDQDTFIQSGCFHYCRCPRELWSDRLMKLKRAGFNTVESYVFWNYHERTEGHLDLSEFEDFVKQVHSMGFWMIVRPGPYVCAEWHAGGFPDWIIAQQFPLRSANPQSITTSQHWYSAVLPVIQRNMITTGGPIIIIQIENEYDYWLLPSAEKAKYVKALAQMVWNAGIEIPIITNWCKEARDNSDPVMGRIMDTADFYPRWNIVGETLGPLGELRKAEPGCPLVVTELQGGWFSQIGGKLSVDQPGVNAAQLNMLAKTMIEHGVRSYSYYMGFGGTSFDWAAKKLTTTYDYAAPIREPGGLWEKYYAARGICAATNRFQALLTRARALEGARSTNAQVTVTERVNGKSGMLFVRENANARQEYTMTFVDPNSPTHRLITVPRQGQLVLGAREMKMLPVQVPLPGIQLRYATADVLDFGAIIDRSYIVIYDEPGRVVEIALATEQQPQVEGDTSYQYWDPEYESVIIGLELNAPEKLLLINNQLMVIALPRDRALRTWMASFPSTLIPEIEEGMGPQAPGTTPETSNMQVPFITDCALLSDSGWEKKRRAWADLNYTPGEHDLTTLWPSEPDKCLVDGDSTDIRYDGHWRTARLHITTPACPARPVVPESFEFWVEKFDPHSGNWIANPPRPLQQFDTLPYGYVKYRADFSAQADAQMAIATFDDDGKQVFVNGKYVKEASTPGQQVQFPLSSYAHPGTNALEISYELFGSYNFGEAIATLKGLKSVSAAGTSSINSWQIQLRPPAMKGREVDPDFSVGGWQPASLGGAPPDAEFIPAFCWVRGMFHLDELPDEWSVMWKAMIDADRDALLYLNGKFVGRYAAVGPQKEFYLPEPWLQFGASAGNILTVVLAYTDQPQHLRTLQMAPYEEFATRKTRVEFRWV